MHTSRVFFFAACAAGMVFLACAPSAEKRPNIVVIFTDDHGWADLGVQGIYSDIRTPHIDSLAAGGVRMTSGYVTAPQCLPSRAGLLTGLYQNRFGLESNRENEGMKAFGERATIAERLKEGGYATGMAGKWHLGTLSKIPSHGFDQVYATKAGHPGWVNMDLNGKDVEPGPEQSGLYHIDSNTAAAVAFIRRNRDKPFFFYLAYRAPHVPLDATQKYLDRFPGAMPERRRQALAMMSAVDDGVGAVMKTLRELSIEEETLIFFISDNGAPLKIHKDDNPLGEKGWDGSLNDPLNGEKGMLTEGGIRVPYIVSWKGTIGGGKTYHQPVISLDVMATALSLAGLPEDSTLDGVDLVPYLTGKKEGAPHEALFWRWTTQAAVRAGKWKYLRGGQRSYLFDLDTDKEEKRSLLATHPAVAADLEAKLEVWASELSPPGLTLTSVKTSWEIYFDFYLDGKPPPPLRWKADMTEPGAL